MAKSWYRVKPDLYEAVCREVEDAYPELRFIDDGNRIILKGWYLLHEGSQVWDRYLIEVTLPTDSPRGFPVIREVGGRIPCIPDRHVYDNGDACVALEDSFWFEYPNGLSLLEFLAGPLRSYFASQSLIEMGETEPWPAGEWGHGADGIFQFYSNALGIKNPLVILDFLKLLERDEVKGHWPCPCKSGEKLRKCHGESLYKLRSRIPKDVAARSRASFQKAVEKVASEYKYKVKT